jgi:asparagine synthase (glutamine-hydrolysing)
LGVRPLYYTQACGKFLFASEIKSLFVDPDVIRQIEPRELSQLFTFWATLPPTTVYQGVEELAPGCNLTLEDGRMEVRPYWRLEYGGGDAEEEEYADRVVELLGDAARLRLRADVAVGAYLSGGLDSSFVTALIHKEAGARLRTFSVTFEEPEFDESRQQRLVADHLGTDHRAVHCPAGEIARVFPEVIWHTEAPVLRTAPAPLFLLSKLVRDEGFKVVLTGEGADEMLGGYDIFKEAKVRRFCAAQPESAFRAALLGRLYPYLPRLQAQPLGYRRAFFRTRREDLDNPFFSHLPRWRLTSQLTRLFSPELLSMLGQYDAEADARALLPEAYSAWDPFCQAQYLETAILLPGYILSSQGDRVSLAHSVEGRHPFLDYRFVELAARIPPRLKMKALKEKFILKRAAKRFLPSSVVERPKQPYRAPDAMSFFHPESARARGDYIEELLSPERIRADGVFQPDAVRLLVQKVRRGEPVGVRDNMAFVGVLSTQLLIEQFLRNFPRAAAKRFAAAATPAWRQEPQTTGLCGRC